MVSYNDQIQLQRLWLSWGWAGYPHSPETQTIRTNRGYIGAGWNDGRVEMRKIWVCMGSHGRTRFWNSQPTKTHTRPWYFIKSFTFSTLQPSRASCKNFNNTPGLDFVFRTRLLVFSENKIRTNTIWIFCVFFLCQGSLLTIIRPPHKLQCNCRGRMSGQQWPWHHKHS